mmetsp:Transcript_6440/g.7399  ORF Transcript_6440/g.7399 Transcript_6440/m.7399 type:complete len:217 (-) Transcript_6440:224-874(-)
MLCIMHLHVTLGCLGSRAGGAPLGERLAAALLGLLHAQSKKLLVLSSFSLCLANALGLNSSLGPLALKLDGGDKTLDSGGLGVLLAVLLEVAAGDVFADIVILGEQEQLADLGCTLGGKTTRNLGIGKSGKLVITNFDDDQVQGGKVRGDDATTGGLATALTVAASVTLEALSVPGHEKTDTSWGEHTLLHGETLLVLATSDLEDVALELIAQAVA